MATQILDNAFVEFASNDLSAYVRSVTLNYEAETQDETAMGDDTRIMKGGLKNWSVEVELNQDFASSALDSIVFSLVGTTGTLKVRQDGGSASTSNPEYSGTALLTSYPPFGNSVGDLATTSLSFAPAGTLSRATS